jgi:hypothetical protein
MSQHDIIDGGIAAWISTQPSDQDIQNAIIDECVLVALGGAKQCAPGDSEWHRGFRYAASNTALLIADRIRALKHASVSREGQS